MKSFTLLTFSFKTVFLMLFGWTGIHALYQNKIRGIFYYPLFCSIFNFWNNAIFLSIFCALLFSIFLLFDINCFALKNKFVSSFSIKKAIFSISGIFISACILFAVTEVSISLGLIQMEFNQAEALNDNNFTIAGKDKNYTHHVYLNNLSNRQYSFFSQNSCHKFLFFNDQLWYCSYISSGNLKTRYNVIY